MSLQELSDIPRELWVVWLLLLFAGIIVWVFWPRRKKELEDQANIPFRDDNGET